ncbi:unnamed protein product [Anisakis simplex]|uniref:INB domain-containing protein n=1 Tax=Anisakis simplex TaxID=6269 RepID=A0A0M3JEE6_ANISI|nr:unnamed protein product [Anisakis simplex]
MNGKRVVTVLRISKFCVSHRLSYFRKKSKKLKFPVISMLQKEDSTLSFKRLPVIIGWRERARKMIVFSTDAGFHFAGDGRVC